MNKNFNVETENLIYVKKNFWVQYFCRAIVLMCAIIASFIICFTIAYETAPVYGVSMQPNLNKLGATKSDVVYIHKFAKVNYGDIVVLEKKSNSDVDHIIKRVIGMPGDVIEIKQDDNYEVSVYRNGEKLVEDYIFNIATSGDPNNLGMMQTLDNFIKFKHSAMLNPDNSNAVFDNKGRLVLQKNQIFVLGDNRGYSIDSSVEGPFSLDSVVGRVDFVVPYGVVPFYYFLNEFAGINLMPDLIK